MPERLLTTSALGRPTEILSEAASTNDYIKAKTDTISHGHAVYTLRQTAGKGRLGRTWNDGGGKALALSVFLTGLTPATRALLPLCCGLAVTEAVEGLTGRVCTLKWPNDVLMNERKLSGILCEGFTVRGAPAAVAGMGVNLYQTADELTRAGLPHACSLLCETGRRFDSEEVAAAILNRLEAVITACDADGFSAIRGRYESKCINIGRQVRVLFENRERTGVAAGIGSDGCLLVDCGGETLAVRSGEASIRGIFGYC